MHSEGYHRRRRKTAALLEDKGSSIASVEKHHAGRGPCWKPRGSNWPIAAGHDSDNTPESRPLEHRRTLACLPATAGRQCAGPLIGATDSSRLWLDIDQVALAVVSMRSPLPPDLSRKSWDCLG